MKIKIIFLILLMQFFSGIASAAKTDYIKLYHDDLMQIEAYLNNLHQISANFTQTSETNQTAHGLFLLSRPGKMRIEYKEPNKILIIVNGPVLAYKDLELDETSYLTTNSTPASLLTRKNISFSAKDVEVTNVYKTANEVKVSLLKKNRKEAGEFTLTFKTNPLEFFKMEVKNDLGETSTITLDSPNFISEIKQNNFIVRNSNLPK